MDVIFPILLQKGLIIRRPKHPTYEYFINYDPSISCDYHSGEIGHSLDNCDTLKNRIQDLLDARAFTFRAPWLCHGEDDLLVVPNIRTAAPELSNKARKGKAIMDTLGEPSGKFDYYVDYQLPSSFYEDQQNDIPSGWDDVEKLTPLKRGADELDSWNDTFEEFFVGAIDEGPVEGMGAGPLE